MPVARNATFEILYQDYYPRVFGLCRRLLNSQELAEDATQETFMRAYRSFAKYKTDQPFWHWVATIANNYCIDLLRQQSRTPTLFGDETAEQAAIEAHEISSQESHLLNDLIAMEQADTLNQAINQLDTKYRVPLTLAYFSQFSYDEIATALSVSRNHVGVLLLRGRQMLRTQLQAELQGSGAQA